MENANEKLPMHQGAKPEIFVFARKNRENNTDAEKILWESLRLKRLDGFKFRNQHPIGNYILDFYCHSAKVAIEVDGGYHFQKEQKEYDDRKDEAIELTGVKIIRFTNEEVLNELPKVLNKIREYLTSPPYPVPPLTPEGEP